STRAPGPRSPAPGPAPALRIVQSRAVVHGVADERPDAAEAPAAAAARSIESRGDLALRSARVRTDPSDRVIACGVARALRDLRKPDWTLSCLQPGEGDQDAKLVLDHPSAALRLRDARVKFGSPPAAGPFLRNDEGRGKLRGYGGGGRGNGRPATRQAAPTPPEKTGRSADDGAGPSGRRVADDRARPRPVTRRGGRDARRHRLCWAPRRSACPYRARVRRRSAGHGLRLHARPRRAPRLVPSAHAR